jgi:hypothetical protein
MDSADGKSNEYILIFFGGERRKGFILAQKNIPPPPSHKLFILVQLKSKNTVRSGFQRGGFDTL